MLTRLLFRTLPEYYPPGSVYAHFPFLVPERVRKFLSKLHESPVKKYTFTRPPVPLPVMVVQDYAEVKRLLESREALDGGVLRRLSELVRNADLNVRLVRVMWACPEVWTEADHSGAGKRSARESRLVANCILYKASLAKTAEELIRAKSLSGNGRSSSRVVDIVKDIIDLVPVYFVSTQLVWVQIDLMKRTCLISRVPLRLVSH
jgi:hypothetical protein